MSLYIRPSGGDLSPTIILHKYDKSDPKITAPSNRIPEPSQVTFPRLAQTIGTNIGIMSDSTSNLPNTISDTENISEGVTKITVQVSKLEAAEDRTRDIINRISSLLQSQNVNEKQTASLKKKNSKKQEVSDKQIELTASIITLNNIREQSRSRYRLLYTLWGKWDNIQGQNGNEEIAGQVRRLNQTHERNRQDIVALWREVRDLHRQEEKLVGEKGVVGCKVGEGGMDGVAWGDVLKVFSGMELGF